MRKGLGLVLALFLGGAVVYGVHNTNTPADVAAYHQQTTQPAQTSTAPAQPTASQPPTKQTTTLSNGNYYTNSDGNRVHAPARSSDGVPAGATAVCRDGTYSFSQHRQGTCSHHGGVDHWL
jgi:hypothetical protein